MQRDKIRNYPDTFAGRPTYTTSVRHYKVGYEVRHLMVKPEPDRRGRAYVAPIPIVVAFTADGHFIGSSRDAHRLMVRMGIQPELRTRHSQTCSIGYSRRRRKWYGWSHRAIAGFRTRTAAARFAQSVS